MKTDILLTAKRPAASANAVPGNTDPSCLCEKSTGQSSSIDDRLGLTWRDQETLACLRLHLYDKEIAGRLGIAIPSVKSRVRRLLGKFGVRSRRELI
jgi:DNA-binding CsgD family transcriptional regulator